MLIQVHPILVILPFTFLITLLWSKITSGILDSWGILLWGAHLAIVSDDLILSAILLSMANV